MSQFTPSDRVTHLATLMHRAEMSNGTSVPSNWKLASVGSNFLMTWTPDGAAGGVSYASNSTDVSDSSAAGASTLVSPADHRHRGVHLISSAGSNSLFGDVNFVGQGSVGVTVSGQTIQISGPGNTGAGGGSGTSPLLQPFFGDGHDGAAVISVDTTITKDMYYSNLTVNAGVNLDTALLRVFVSGTLTLNGTIRCNGNNGGNGGNGTAGAGGAAGAAGAQQTGGSVQNLPNGSAGRAGVVGGINANGANGTAASQSTFSVNVPAGTNGGQSGSGRSGGTGGAGTTGTDTAQDKPYYWPRVTEWKVLTGTTDFNMDIISGRAASGGSGGGAAASGGGGSGGSGSSAGFVVVCARTLTGSGKLQAKGGNGGNGGNGLAAAQAGGGAGGNGGQGGVAVLIYREATGWTGTIDVSGGSKGTKGLAGGGAGSTDGQDGNDGGTGKSFTYQFG